MIPFINQAFADESVGGSQVMGGMFQFMMLGVFFLIFWLLIWRPQNKRAKEHKSLMNDLSKGDEVATSGGILGRIVSVTDDYVTLQVTHNMELSFQKSSVVAALPKGTIKAIK
ncbi:MAG: preprotein translocase subunit YajC [Endozoicomonadaceae bacterium]|nr:preprotein translocase subunit YajC [Endozoicomonadaceae bacterium]